MKTKALLLTLMILVAFACSNDDNGPVEQEEQVEYKIKKVIKNSVTPGEWSQELLFDQDGRLIEDVEIIDSDGTTYYISNKFSFNENNKITERMRYVNGELSGESYHFEYDTANRLIKIVSVEGGNSIDRYVFEYNGDKMKMINLLGGGGFNEYTFDNSNKIIQVETQSGGTGGESYLLSLNYSQENLISMLSVQQNCSNCSESETSIVYDNKYNPLFENFGNIFFYFSLANPFSEYYRDHFSPDNVISLSVEYNNGNSVTYDNEIIYNDAEYPTYIKQFKDGVFYRELNFEYYE